MSKYKQYRLITIDQLIAKCDNDSNLIEYSEDGKLLIRTENYHWTITESSMKRFGRVVKAKRIADRVIESVNFTHIDKNDNHLYHQFWFAEDEFIKKDEFSL